MKPRTAAGVGLLVYLSGQDKIKPPTGSGRRERISVHHDELITGVDLFLSVHELLNVQSVLGVIVGGVLNLLFTLNTTALPVLPKMGVKK